LQGLGARFFDKPIAFHTSVFDGRLILIEQTQVMIQIFPGLPHQSRSSLFPFRLHAENGPEQKEI
jgi:hypothetical protein